jgi:hypothetical protein
MLDIRVEPQVSGQPAIDSGNVVLNVPGSRPAEQGGRTQSGGAEQERADASQY